MTDTTSADTTTADLAATIERYMASWNEADPTARGDLVRRTWTSDGRHVDPLADVEGHAALDAMVAGVQERFAGHRISRVTGVDLHHDQFRFGWQLAAPDSTVVVSAVDIGEIAGDGRLRRVSAFFGELPAES